MSDLSKQNDHRKQRSLYQVHYCLKKQEEEAPHPAPWRLSDMDIQAYRSQVAGHQKTDGKKYLGLLQTNNATILKPILKDMQKREIDFYEKLKQTENQDLIELQSYVPQYKGCQIVSYNGFEHNYIILEDLIRNMLEPCIMDVKIGKRTWDPVADEKKMANEKLKYSLSKEEYGFCIPGYQVYELSSGQLHKYGKEHGKKLHGEDVIHAIKNYLNSTETGICRSLILQFLSELWKIEKWSARQTAIKLYSSSLLLVYDAVKVRTCCGDHEDAPFKRKCTKSDSGLKLRYSDPLNLETSGSNFSGQLTDSGPQYRKVSPVPLSPMSLAQKAFSPHTPTASSPWSEALDRISPNHSFQHNYDEVVSKMKINYKTTLDQLSNDKSNPHGNVKIIDFAHAFFNDNDDHSVDSNFRDGLANLVRIFEKLLRESNE